MFRDRAGGGGVLGKLGSSDCVESLLTGGSGRGVSGWGDGGVNREIGTRWEIHVLILSLCAVRDVGWGKGLLFSGRARGPVENAADFSLPRVREERTPRSQLVSVFFSFFFVFYRTESTQTSFLSW